MAKNYGIMIRKITLIVLFIDLLGWNIAAQENDGRFLLRDSKAKITTFYAEVSPVYSSSLMDNNISLIEIAGGLIINQKFTIAYFTTTGKPIENAAVPMEGTDEYQKWVDAGVEVDKLNSNTEFVYARFKHSGINLGYLHKTQNTVFWRTVLHFGFTGGFNLSEGNNFLGVFDNVIYEAKIITVEPSLGLGINLLPWWRLHLDAGYRIINIDNRIIEPKKVDSFTMKFGFAFGNFRQVK